LPNFTKTVMSKYAGTDKESTLKHTESKIIIEKESDKNSSGNKLLYNNDNSIAVK